MLNYRKLTIHPVAPSGTAITRTNPEPPAAAAAPGSEEDDGQQDALRTPRRRRRTPRLKITIPLR